VRLRRAGDAAAALRAQPAFLHISCVNRHVDGNAGLSHLGGQCRSGLQWIGGIRFVQFLFPAARWHGGVSGGSRGGAISRSRAPPCPGILRAPAICHRRHGRSRFGAGVAHRVHRPGDELHLQLHPGGLPPRFAEIQRISDEVLPAGFVRDGIFFCTASRWYTARRGPPCWTRWRTRTRPARC